MFSSIVESAGQIRISRFKVFMHAFHSCANRWWFFPLSYSGSMISDGIDCKHIQVILPMPWTSTVLTPCGLAFQCCVTTGDFAEINKLGEGGFGAVYKDSLPN